MVPAIPKLGAMINRTESKPRSGTYNRYHEALCDLRNNPGVYAQQEWCNRHGIGHSVPRALIQLGLASRVNNRLHLLRERITDGMIQDIIRQKRTFDNLRHAKHGVARVRPTTLFSAPEKVEDAPPPTEVVPNGNTPTQPVGTATVTVNMPARSVSVFWGLLKFNV
jgi:hypothetical protein